jgi:twitching motility protein PilT
MVPAAEVMVSTARIRELIEDPQRTREIRDAIAQGRDGYGMISFDQSLIDLVQRRLVTYEEAIKNSSTPDDFALAFRDVSDGGAQDGWQQEQVNKQNPGTGQPGRPTAPSGQAAPNAAPGFEIERFGRE